jgi:Receptor family ligand binding region
MVLLNIVVSRVCTMATEHWKGAHGPHRVTAAIPSPRHKLGDRKLANLARRTALGLLGWPSFAPAKTGKQPADYSITYYDATQVIFDAMARVAKSGKPVNRANVRDAIQATSLDTLQGNISFDANGDMKSKVVSIFQVQYDTKAPIGDVVHQFKYVGVAPEV